MNNGPGTAICPEGTPESCFAVTHSGNFVKLPTSGDVRFHWESDGGQAKDGAYKQAPPRFHGTVTRRRVLSRIALKKMSDAFREKFRSVDFEKITEALPVRSNYLHVCSANI
jgi:hypothetical protein